MFGAARRARAVRRVLAAGSEALVTHGPHIIPGHVFEALARGGGGAEAAALLAKTQRSRRLLLLRGVLDGADRFGEPWGSEARRAYDLLASWHGRSGAGSGTLEQVLSHPGVAAWATRVLRAASHDEPAPMPGYLPAVAAVASIRLGLPAEVSVPVLHGRVLLPGLGAADVAPAGSAGAATVRVGVDGGAVIECGMARISVPADPARSLPGWTGLPRVTASAGGHHLRVRLDAVDPFCFPVRDDVHAVHTVVHAVTEAAAGRWRDTAAQGWDLLASLCPDTAAEVGGVVSVLVPLRAPQGGAVSATTATTFGVIALSEPADATAFALTLAHEVQHLKLYALLDLVPLVDDAGQVRSYAPWRDDPRPLPSLLNGAYAHLAVARFWRGLRLRERSARDAGLHAHTQFARWREAIWTALETLRASGVLTAAGRRFTSGMAATVAGWLDDPVPPEALRRARSAADLHRRTWLSHHAGQGGTDRNG
jgi:HEXXH motif-containing protein